MKRPGLLSSALVLLAPALVLGACASPSEVEVASVAATADLAAPLLVEAAPLEASIQALEPAPAPILVADAEDALVMPVTYSCADRRSFVATFPEHGRAVTVAAAGEVRTLAHRDGADAALFTDAAGATLTAEGAGATLTGFGRAYTDCMAG